ncbi:MAG TPA: L,D-transpeptidase family protein [Sphingomicrobium sp.]|nr:L,D-transpeptidase family protein [Sphingomicrobium sp.]
MNKADNWRTGFKPVRRLSLLAGAVAAFAAAPVFYPAAQAAVVEAASGQSVEHFYEARGGRLLWFGNGEPNAAASELLSLLETASADSLEPDRYNPESLARLVERASAGDERARRKADLLLSRALVAYAQDLRKLPGAGPEPDMVFVDPRLRPGQSSPRRLLEMAADSPSLEEFIARMGWMNPTYAPLRRALAEGRFESREQGDLLRINMERARLLPADIPRYVIVNAAAQQLDMYEGGEITDSMRVVVGKEKDKDRTPMLASFLSSASLNPYWNVPPDLAAERIAPNVLRDGLSYLERQGYQILSDWSEDATILDPASIDWQAVADGIAEIRVRQLPGPANALGKVKFTFANPFGVYLHDTPDKQLLTEETRLFSGGCIRLEDAARFGEWLYGRNLEAPSSDPDIEVELDRPVPVFVTYLTAVSDGSSITYLDDAYGWDAERLAQMESAGARTAIR